MEISCHQVLRKSKVKWFGKLQKKIRTEQLNFGKRNGIVYHIYTQHRINDWKAPL